MSSFGNNFRCMCIDGFSGPLCQRKLPLFLIFYHNFSGMLNLKRLNIIAILFHIFDINFVAKVNK